LSYVGAGNSTNKKDAEKNAAKDFVMFLIRSGKVAENDVPQEEGARPLTAASGGDNSGPPSLLQVVGLFKVLFLEFDHTFLKHLEGVNDTISKCL
jgi:hypothetical protein